MITTAAAAQNLPENISIYNENDDLSIFQLRPLNLTTRTLTPSHPLRHFPLHPQRLNILSLIIMRRNLRQPLTLQRHNTPHKLLARKHQLIKNHPLRPNLHQHRARMNVDGEIILHSPVRITSTLQTRGIGEEARRDALLDGREVRGTA